MRKPFLLISSLAVALTGCASGEVQETLGLGRKAPDEFRVVSRPPLSVPPEFYLRPPEPGAPDLGAPESEELGREAVLGAAPVGSGADRLVSPEVETAVQPVVSTSLASTSEVEFLSRAGVKDADPAIRDHLFKEQMIDDAPGKDASPLERWLGIGPGSSVVDAPAEAERLRANKEAGRPVNEGEVPTRDDNKKSVLEKIWE